MSGLGSAKGPGGSSRHLAQLLDGLPVTDRRLDVAGTSTPVLEGGTGSPIVLLHGIGGFAEEWACVIPELISNHAVVVPDLPGLGRSRLDNATLDAASVVEWLRLLIDQTCDEPPTLVGHSLGGGIAARFAIAHPDMIRRVVLEDSSSLGRFRPAPSLVLALMRFGARPTRANHERFLRQVLFDPDRTAVEWGDRWPASEGYDIELAADKSVSKATGQLVRRIAARRISQEGLASITVPVALIWGTGDRLMRFRIGERAAGAFEWPLYPIEECGHGPHIERPGPFVEALEMAIARREIGT
jgi:pimeloyl-ACP methyl ester carboxylesterase